jgi:hypothetical protein
MSPWSMTSAPDRCNAPSRTRRTSQGKADGFDILYQGVVGFQQRGEKRVQFGADFLISTAQYSLGFQQHHSRTRKDKG